MSTRQLVYSATVLLFGCCLFYAVVGGGWPLYVFVAGLIVLGAWQYGRHRGRRRAAQPQVPMLLTDENSPIRKLFCEAEVQDSDGIWHPGACTRPPGHRGPHGSEAIR